MVGDRDSRCGASREVKLYEARVCVFDVPLKKVVCFV
jgi:hypothetical protein